MIELRVKQITDSAVAAIAYVHGSVEMKGVAYLKRAGDIEFKCIIWVERSFATCNKEIATYETLGESGSHLLL